MAINLLKDRGTPLDRQRMSWKDMVGKPISKLDDDAFTRVRIILMNGLELDALRTKQVAIRCNLEARVPIAQLMRVEQHQALVEDRQRREPLRGGQPPRVGHHRHRDPVGVDDGEPVLRGVRHRGRHLRPGL